MSTYNLSSPERGRFLLHYALSALLAVVLLCSAALAADKPLRPCFPGISGMAILDEHSLLVVYDTKNKPKNADKPRVAALTIDRKGRPELRDVRLTWPASAALPNDLESICPVPGRTDEFLAAESGFYQGRYGRVFHLLIQRANTRWTGAVLAVYRLPADTDNVEGLVCLRFDDQRKLLLLGERGGSDANPNGKLRLCSIGTDNALQVIQEQALSVDDTLWSDPLRNRDIAELYLDPEGRLWGAAAQDQGDGGPFRSVIYLAGKVETQAENPLQLRPAPLVVYRIDGFKVEALCAPLIPGSALSAGTDDEDYGGTWRPLQELLP
ncbi:MAG: hypothetical protein P9M14_15195 [Candidatus Alcyoniella australis]|nr:hypothetical protein [Candidatus Alcyoniella australis]